MRIAVAVLTLLAWLSPAQAARLALVIGNSAYEHTGALPNPASDAEAVADFLASAGFAVTRVADADGEDIAEAVASFGSRLTAEDDAVFYYAGHGLQVGGENWLVGVDATLSDVEDVPQQAVGLNSVISLLESRARVAMVFIDACRNNPLAENLDSASGALPGLAPVEPAGDGTLVAFAAAPGRVAFDGAGANSPFTLALLDNLGDAGAPVEVAFKRVMRDVRDATNNRQSPQYVSSLSTEFFFGDPTPPQLSDNDASRDYERAERIGSVRGWHLYLEKYPEGFLSEMAREALQQLLSETWNADDGIPPEETELRLNLSRRAKVEVQIAISDLGYDLGTPDGVFGPKSREGIKAFQRGAGLRETGFIGFATLAQLGIPFTDGRTDFAVSGRAKVYFPDDLFGLETDARLFAALKCTAGRPVSYGFYEGRLYLAVVAGADRDIALEMAGGCGARLASIESSQENAFVFSIIQNDPQFFVNPENEFGVPGWQAGEGAVIGPTFGLIQDDNGREPNGGWRWATGEPVRYAAWAPGEPSEGSGRQAYSEDVVSYMSNRQSHLSSPGAAFRVTEATWGDVVLAAGVVLEFD